MSGDFKFGLKFVVGIAVAAWLFRIFVIDRQQQTGG